MLAVAYLIFDEGYGGRGDLAAEAIRLGRALAELMPDEPDVDGLLALMLLNDARRGARFAEGTVVLLRDQDRSLWNFDQLARDGPRSIARSRSAAAARTCCRRQSARHAEAPQDVHSGGRAALPRAADGGAERLTRHGRPRRERPVSSRNQRAFELTAIGSVESPLTDPASAPKQGDEGAPDAWLAFEPAVLEALDGIRAGDEVIVLTWLDRARRDVLRVHPRGDVSRVPQGVFSTRSPDRPNPIGLHRVEVASIDGGRLRVRNLEAVDGTPIVDVKPVLSSDIDER